VLSDSIYTLSINNPGVHVQGNRARIFASSNLQDSIITVNGKLDSVSGLWLDGAGQESLNEYAGLRVLGSNDTITNNYVEDVDAAGIYLGAGSTGNLVRDNIVFNATNDGIVASGTVKPSNSIIENNVVETTHIHNCYSLVDTLNIELIENIGMNCGGSGIALENLGVGPNLNTVIESNQINGTNSPVGDGLQFYKETGGVYSGYNVTIIGNTFRMSAQYGIYVGSAENIAIERNSVFSPKQGGIFVGFNTENVSLIGNNIQEPIGTGIILEGQAPYLVSNNTIFLPTKDGIYAGSSPMKFLQIENNRISAPGTDGVEINVPIQKLTVVENSIQNLSYTSGAGILVETSLTGFTFTSNTISSVLSGAPFGIEFSNVTATVANGTISCNHMLGPDYSGSDGVYINTAMTHSSITGNTIASYSNAIFLGASADYISITNNKFESTGTNILFSGGGNVHDIIHDNSNPGSVCAESITLFSSSSSSAVSEFPALLPPELFVLLVVMLVIIGTLALARRRKHSA
jgi:parallel beta-helix repeat protein